MKHKKKLTNENQGILEKEKVHGTKHEKKMEDKKLWNGYWEKRTEKKTEKYHRTGTGRNGHRTNDHTRKETEIPNMHSKKERKCLASTQKVLQVRSTQFVSLFFLLTSAAAHRPAAGTTSFFPSSLILPQRAPPIGTSTPT